MGSTYLTKAYVTEIPPENGNKYKVRVPLFEDNTETEAIFEATLCNPPQLYKGYDVGDAVFVHFEDEKNNSPVILGRLYTSIPKSVSGYVLTEDLTATGNVILPKNTKIGDISLSTLVDLMNGITNGSGDGQPLGDYVKYIKTDFPVISEDGEDTGDVEQIFADRIQIMTGEMYDDLWKWLERNEEESGSGSEGVESSQWDWDIDIEDAKNTLFFLTTPSPTEAGAVTGDEFYSSSSGVGNTQIVPDSKDWKGTDDEGNPTYKYGTKDAGEASKGSSVSSNGAQGRGTTSSVNVAKGDTAQYVNNANKVSFKVHLVVNTSGDSRWGNDGDVYLRFFVADKYGSEKQISGITSTWSIGKNYNLGLYTSGTGSNTKIKNENGEVTDSFEYSVTGGVSKVYGQVYMGTTSGYYINSGDFYLYDVKVSSV